MKLKPHPYSFFSKRTIRLLLALVLLVQFRSVHAQGYTENFDNVGTLTASGWVIKNNSSPLGPNSWYQGVHTTATPDAGPFDAYNGAANAYIAANFASTTGGSGVISNWLITPNRTFRNGDVFTFFTRKPTIGQGQTDYPDRLEVRLSTNGASTDVGTAASTVGDFTTLLLTINPTLTVNVYPQVWTQYTVTISGLQAPTSGRIAFRYFVTGAGPTGTNSDYIGIDNVVYTPYVCPVITISPTTVPGGTAGTSYSQSISATGLLGAGTFAITAGTLPPGLTLAANGTISGTPTATGTFNFTVKASDASGCSGSRAYSITTLCPPNPINFRDTGVCADGGPVTLNFATPVGGTYFGTGVLGGTFEPAAGTSTVMYSFTDPYGCYFEKGAVITPVNFESSVATPSSQIMCSGKNITTIKFTNNAPGVTFNWTRDHTSDVTGIAASGSGDITGSLLNTTESPITVTFTVTPSLPNCTGTPFTATVVVNPALELQMPMDTVVCGSQVVNYSLPIVLAPCSEEQTLTTTFAGNNDQYGTMFNVSATNTITITSIDAHPRGNTTVEIYYKAGSYAGFEFSPQAWTLIGSVDVVAQPFGTPTPIPLPLNITIPAGETYSLYVASTSSTVTLNYTDGSSEGAVYRNDGNLTFYEGVGVRYPFGDGSNSKNSPRIFNGNIHYQLASDIQTILTAGLASGSIFPVGTTTNTYTATDGLGNSVTGSFNVTVNPVPTVNTIANKTICNGSSVTAVNFTGSPAGTVFNWTNDSTSIGLAASGTGNIPSFNGVNTSTELVTSTVRVVPVYTNEGKTCTGDTLDFNINIYPTPQVTSVSVPADATYEGGQKLSFYVNFSENVSVNSGGGIPSIPVTLNTGGTVQATYVSGSGGASLLFEYIVSATDQDNDGIVVGNTLNLNGGAMYSSGSCNISTTLNGIPSTAGIKIHNPVPQTITFGALSAKTYGDADFNLNASATSGLGITYTSSDPSVATVNNGEVHVVSAGSTTITATQAGNGDYLAATPVQQVLLINKATLTATAEDRTICFGDVVGAVAITYSGFKNGEDISAVSSTPMVDVPTINSAGNYQLTPMGGAAKNYVYNYVNGNLTVHPKPSGNIAQASSSGGVVSGYQLTAPAGSSYVWSTGETTSSILVRAAGNYTVTVTSQHGCVNNFNHNVSFQTLSIPNTFSPNGDGINDYWTIPALANYPNAYVTIVNRNGQVVYESRNFTRWDGRSGGRELPSGVYFYRVRKAPGEEPVTGWLNLVR